MRLDKRIQIVEIKYFIHVIYLVYVHLFHFRSESLFCCLLLECVFSQLLFHKGGNTQRGGDTLVSEPVTNSKLYANVLLSTAREYLVKAKR